jgi:arylsulfatase
VTPFSQYKAWVAEGGIRNALIVSGPGIKRPAGSINTQGVMHVADIMPTLLAVAGTRYQRQRIDGETLPPLLGKPWTAVLAGRAESPRTPRDALAWELFGNRAVRQGDWKARWLYKPFGKADWELFDVTADPGENQDLAAARPDKLRELVKAWEAYAKANGVVLPSRSVFEARGDAASRGPAADPDFPPLMRMRQFIPPKEMMAEPKP